MTPMGDVKNETVSPSRISHNRLTEMQNAACDRMMRDFDVAFQEFTALEAYNLVTELLALRQPDTSEGGGEDVVRLTKENEALRRERDALRIQSGKIGPELWGRFPGTGVWHQITDGSNTDEQVTGFEAIYADVGWTELRRTNPFLDDERMADKARIKALEEALRPLVDRLEDEGVILGSDIAMLTAARSALQGDTV